MEVVVEAVHLNPPLLLAFQHIGMDQHRILMLFCHGVLLVTQPVTWFIGQLQQMGVIPK